MSGKHQIGAVVFGPDPLTNPQMGERSAMLRLAFLGQLPEGVTLMAYIPGGPFIDITRDDVDWLDDYYGWSDENGRWSKHG